MKFYLQLKEVVEKLSDQERIMLIVTLVVTLFFLLYTLLWLPLSEEREKLSLKIVKDIENVFWMHSAVEQYKQSSSKKKVKQQAAIPKNKSLLSVVDDTVKGFKLKNSLKRIEPNGKSGVKLFYENGIFDSLVKWLGMMKSKYNVEVMQLNLSRVNSTGVINAHIILHEVKE